MAGGYQVGIGSETKAFKQGIDSGVIAPLEDAQKELLELGRNRGPEQLEKQLREDQKATEKLGDETKRTAAAIEREYRDSYRKMKTASDDALDDGVKGMSKLRDGASEVTQEVGSNLGEAVSSFRGDITDLGQVGQDTLGGLAATLAGGGPLGIVGAAGLAAAAIGVGGLAGEQQKLNEQVQHLKEYYAEAWRTAIEGGHDYIDVASLIAEMQDLISNPERAGEYKAVLEDAKRLGLDRNTLIQAYLGDENALSIVLARNTDLYADAADKAKTVAEEQHGTYTEAAKAADADRLALEKLGNKYGELSRNAAAAKQSALDAASSTSEYLLKVVNDAEGAAVSVDELGNKMVELPDGKTVYISADTGKASLELDTFKGDADGVIDHVNRRDIKLKVTTDTSAAERSLKSLIERGRVIKIGTRIVGPDGGWD